jgi:hypothetical protein
LPLNLTSFHSEPLDTFFSFKTYHLNFSLHLFLFPFSLFLERQKYLFFLEQAGELRTISLKTKITLSYQTLIPFFFPALSDRSQQLHTTEFMVNSICFPGPFQNCPWSGKIDLWTREEAADGDGGWARWAVLPTLDDDRCLRRQAREPSARPTFRMGQARALTGASMCGHARPGLHAW